MATTPEHLPHIPHFPVPDVKGGLRWLGHHWKPVGLSLATGIGGGYLALAHDRGPSAPPVNNAPVSDTFKPPEGGQIPSSQSPDNPSVSAPSDTGPDNPPDPAQELETVKPFDCGILSPEACATGEYIQWNVLNPETTATVPVIGIGFRLKAGEKLKIPEDLQVATEEYPEGHTYNGRRIAGVSKDGRRFTFIGAVAAAEGLTDVGKNLPGGTVVGTATGSNVPVIEGAPYNVLLLSSEGDRKRTFPEQTKEQPKVVSNRVGGSLGEGGLTWYDVPPKT